MGYLSKLVTLTDATSNDDHGVFYGQPNGFRRPKGFYKRTGRNNATQLLIAAAKQSKYKTNAPLQKGWNTSVKRAGGKMAPETALRIMRAVRILGRSPI